MPEALRAWRAGSKPSMAITVTGGPLGRTLRVAPPVLDSSSRAVTSSRSAAAPNVAALIAIVRRQDAD
jgi:hypothetical protein